MAYEARVIKDSLSPDGIRLTTMEVTFPRIVLAEFNTHRAFSRNSASSRAIPVEKMMRRVQDDPFIPIYWGKNQKGMQAEQELDELQIARALDRWLNARNDALFNARELLDIGVHKQITNRLVEPFLWHTVIVSSTEWDNWDGLRMGKEAQPEIKRIADMMHEARARSQPDELPYGAWHLPLVDDVKELWDGFKGTASVEADSPRGASTGLMRSFESFLVKVCVGRCARVSYLTHDGKRDPWADVDLAMRLLGNGHMSPFEHAARPMTQLDADRVLSHMTHHNVMVPFLADITRTFNGNFRGWTQARKLVPNEDNFREVWGSVRDLELPVDEE